MKTIAQIRFCLGVFFLAFGAVHSSAAVAAHDLSNSINERLSYMKDVAAYKWLHDRPIEDLDREAVVLDAAARSGLDSQLKIDSSKTFFSLQITAAKEIQHYWFDHWRASGRAPEKPADLARVVRPKLIELGARISRQLADHESSQSIQAGSVQIEGLSNETANALVVAAKSIEQYESPLRQVLDSRVLRVGTTLDYQPFSYEKTEGGGLGNARGIDIDLAQDLAASLDAKVEFVQTSWPTLMADLTAGKFDIGMSGISISLARQRTAYFSSPYHTGGKAAIARCENSSGLNSLTEIDQPTTRIIVNPGGTNERFVRTNIKRGQVILHQDNRTIFQEIIDDKADVMITDKIEVTVQSNLNAVLCPALDETLTFQQKAYLLPPNTEWKHYVDTWLKQRQGDGTVSRIFSQHLAQ